MITRRGLLQLLSYLGLALTLVPGVLVFAGTLTLPAYRSLILAGTLLWIATAPFWINQSSGDA